MSKCIKLLSVLLFSFLFLLSCKNKNQSAQNENKFENENQAEINSTQTNTENKITDDQFEINYDIDLSDEHELTDEEVKYLNKKIHDEVEKQKKDPTCFFHYTEDVIRIVNEITERLSKIPQDEFIKMVEATQASDGRDKDKHFVWFDNQGRKVHWKRHDDTTECWYFYESFTYGEIICEMTDFGTKHFYGTDLYGNQFYHKNDWEDATWYKYDSNKKIIYSKEVNGNEKWYLYDKKGEILYVKESDGSEWYNEVYQNSNNFFGFNTWEHTETSEDHQTHSITRYLFDNGKYYLRSNSKGYPDLIIKDYVRNGMFYTPIQIYFLQDNSTERKIELVENCGNYQTYYDFTKNNNFINLNITGDDKGIISNYSCNISKNKITINYSIERKYYNYMTDELLDTENFNCQEVFYNTSRKILSETIVYQLNEIIYCDKDEEKEELTKKMLPNLHKPELRVARNLIFARHGYIFKSQDLKDLFSTFNWYEPQVEDSTSIVLTPEEKFFVEQIQACESKF